jgi:hypothetical protein
MSDAPDRVALPENELYILREAALTPQVCGELLEFNRAYQQRVLEQFLRFKLDWEELYPGKTFPGICAEVNSITGVMRPLEEQRAWTWGDGRGLGIWCYFLLKGRIADEELTLTLESGDERTVNLRAEYDARCDHIYRCLVDRYEACNGGFPFMVDVETNQSSDDPRNFVAASDEASASDIFCLTAMLQYGLLRGEGQALEIGEKLLAKCVHAAATGSYPVAEDKPGHRFQGSPMVTVGALVDVLKGIGVLESQGVTDHADLKARLIGHARMMVDYILSNHYDPETHDFWEENGPDGEPWINEKGQQICDPGHTAEACGFFAELCSFLPENECASDFAWNREAILGTILEMNHLVTLHGFCETGVMFKNIDLKTKQGVSDTSGGGAKENRPTAPWWNVREHCAACLKLYELSGDARCLEGYRKSQNASYLHYPNANTGGLMVQTLDPFTLKALDIFPATGNLDPMHSPRAREREIEALERIVAAL